MTSMKLRTMAALCVVAGWAGAQGDDPMNPLTAAVGAGTGVFTPGATPYNAAGFVVPGPPPFCTPAVDPSDVWFIFTATVSGTAVATTCPASEIGSGASASPSDVYLAAWDVATFPLTVSLECSESSHACGTLEAEIQFPVVAGSSYYIQLGSTIGVANQGVLLVSLVAGCPAPSNDLAQNALPVSASPRGLNNLGLFTTACATGPTNVAGTTRDVWFVYTSNCPCYVTVAAAPCGTGAAPIVTVFAGSPSGTATSGTATVKVLLCPGDTIYISVGDRGAGGAAFKLTMTFVFTEKWTDMGPGSAKREIGAGAPGSIFFAPLTLDFLHPGLPPGASFPNGWFYGVPLTFSELTAQVTWPGGLPFLGILDPIGNAVAVNLPPGTLSAISGATIWSVALNFDPLTGLLTDVADANAFVIP
jgi:hypothetical protein